MEIRLNNVIYHGLQNDDDTRHLITIPQRRGCGEHSHRVKIKEKDLDDLLRLTGQSVSLIGVCKKGTSIEKCTFSLVRENEPNPAEAEADAAAKAAEQADRKLANNR